MPRTRATLLAISLAAILPASLRAEPPAPAPDPALAPVTVFRSGDAGYHTYRIPAVIRAANGDLLAFCEGRRNSPADSGDIDLLLRRSTDGGKTWLPVQTLFDDGANTCGNPCPVLDASTGHIHLLINWSRGSDNESKILQGKSDDGRHVYLTRSEDHGRTWSPLRRITDSVKPADWRWYVTGPGAGIQLERGPHKGRLVVPSDHSASPWQNPAASYRSHVIYSDDGGKTWSVGGVVEEGVNECEVVELSDGRLMLNMRNYRRDTHRARAVALSADAGETWSDARTDPALIEPVCQASIRRLRWPTDNEPGVLLFSNPADERSRVNLTVRASFDDGATWPLARTLYKGPAAYSCLVKLDNDTAGCLYESDNYQRIDFTRFTLDSLRPAVE